MPLLLGTLLSPWRRLTDDTEVHVTDFYAMFERGVVNVTMRIVGLAIRIIFLVMGTFMLSLTFILGLVGFLSWFVLPLALILLVVAGLQLLVTV
jgi:hypothetical protein